MSSWPLPRCLGRNGDVLGKYVEGFFRSRIANTSQDSSSRSYLAAYISNTSEPELRISLQRWNQQPGVPGRCILSESLIHVVWNSILRAQSERVHLNQSSNTLLRWAADGIWKVENAIEDKGQWIRLGRGIGRRAFRPRRIWILYPPWLTFPFFFRRLDF